MVEQLHCLLLLHTRGDKASYRLLAMMHLSSAPIHSQVKYQHCSCIYNLFGGEGIKILIAITKKQPFWCSLIKPCFQLGEYKMLSLHNHRITLPMQEYFSWESARHKNQADQVGGAHLIWQYHSCTQSTSCSRLWDQKIFHPFFVRFPSQSPAETGKGHTSPHEIKITLEDTASKS